MFYISITGFSLLFPVLIKYIIPLYWLQFFYVSSTVMCLALAINKQIENVIAWMSFMISLQIGSLNCNYLDRNDWANNFSMKNFMVIDPNKENSALHCNCYQRFVTSNPNTLQSHTGKYRVLQGNPCNENRIPAMRTWFIVMKTGFSLREFPVNLPGFGFAVQKHSSLCFAYFGPEKYFESTNW